MYKRPFQLSPTALLLLAALPGAHATDSINGAGSSAASPVYRIWATEYSKTHPAALVYEPIGSGAGMARINKREVDFGASDVIASSADLKKNGLVMFPTVITGIVPVVNLGKLPAGGLRLSGDVLARIFLGQIAQWDAPEIRALNPDAKLPARAIRLVVRADGSGTTYHFSDYLSRSNAAWKQKFGVASRLEWPAGAIAVKGSAEVSKAVRATPDSIAYIDYNYMVDDGLAAVSMKNADGQFVEAGTASFHEAVMHSTWYTTGDFSTELNGLPGPKSWPITMGTYIAIPRVAADGERAARALQFITWAYLNGDALARTAKFVPLPEKVQASAYAEIAKVAGPAGEAIGMSLMGGLLK
ncbi:MAG: phosphate ABC transporter substrate-binding protein PstS [Betaproteobacteria bacterium]